jgi:formate--tetrahydrofolate ligase
MSQTQPDDVIATEGLSRAKPIAQIAQRMGLPTDGASMLAVGPLVAKFDARKAHQALSSRKPGHLILVTAMTPTKSGSGKTLSTIGLMDSLNRVVGGERQAATAVLRQPSMGPVFGMKGGAAGGGHAQLIPPDDINIHFTGDIHAITAAHNMLFSLGVAYAFHEKNKHGVDLNAWAFPNTVDMVDRSLRDALITPSGNLNMGSPATNAIRARWVITAASEVMATLGMSADLDDLGKRLGRLVLGAYKDGRPLTAKDVDAVPAMQAILLKALHPNLVQSLDGNGAWVHTGPFANIAHGNPSLTALKLATQGADYTLTEAGFAADLGAQKFLDIVCPAGGLTPSGAVIVCSTRDLKRQSASGDPVDGVWNLRMHVENLKSYGIPVMAVMNRFTTDTDEEMARMVAAVEKEANIHCVPHTCHRDGSKGGEAAAKVLLDLVKQPQAYKPLINAADPVKEKIEKVARKIYRAGEVRYAPGVEEKLVAIQKLSPTPLQVCMAKTQFSISDDGDVVSDPTGRPITITEVRYAGGPGWIVALAGKVFEMPGMSYDTAGARKISLVKDDSVFGGHRLRMS